MTRVVNIDTSETTIKSLCKRQSIRISTIEPLLSGGTRVVLADPADADTVRELMRDKLLSGTTKRSSSYVLRRPIPWH